MIDPSDVISSEEGVKRNWMGKRRPEFTCEISKRNITECYCAGIWRVRLLPVLVEIHSIQIGF